MGDDIPVPKPSPAKKPSPAVKPIRYYTLKEFAELCRCTKNTVRRMMAMRRLKGVVYSDTFKTGRIVFEKKSADEFLSKRERATPREYDPSVYLR